MGFLDTLRKKTNAAPKAARTAAKTDVTTSEADASATPVAKASVGKGNALSFRLLRTPHVSEKAARLAHAGTYVFDVPVDAEKVSIKKAVEGLYKVKVQAVRTVRGAGKPVRRGKHPGTRNRWKKALVTLAKGQTIDIYEGV